MSEEKKEEKKAEEGAEEKPKSKASPVNIVLGLLVPAILAGGGAFGGSWIGVHKQGHSSEKHEEGKDAHAPGAALVRPPGPTVPLEAFLVTLTDANGKSHPMKMTMQLELYPESKPDELKPYMPRIRDSLLKYLRSRPYEKVSAPASEGKLSGVDQMREEILEELTKLGVSTAQKVLITDFVLQ